MAGFLKRLFGKGGSEATRDADPPRSRASPKRFGDDRARMYDLYQSRVLHAQLAVPAAERDSNWHEAFFPAAWYASVVLGDPPITPGPDGYPYLRLAVPADESFEAVCLANLAQYAIDNGAGAAFYASPQASAPIFSITLGQLYSLQRYDRWDGDPQDVDETRRGPIPDLELAGAGGEPINFQTPYEIMLGAPSRDFLPPALAAGLYRHLTLGWGVTDPKVGILIDRKVAPTRNLLLNLKDTDAPNAAAIEAHLESLLWYLPPARALALLPDGWSDENMVPLADYVDRTRA